MTYKLHNKKNGNDLTYSSIGMWNSGDLEEAQKMQEAVRTHLRCIGMEFLQESIVVIEVESGKEITEEENL